MYKNNIICIVIPCYNEEERIGNILEKLPDFVDEITVVDNNSIDRTVDIASRLGAKVIEEKRQGVGWATRRGFEGAQGDILVVMDGDGQHKPEDIERFLELLLAKKVDVVFGTRFYNRSKRNRSGGALRDIGNKVQTSLFNLLFQSQLSDSQCGMWAFKRSVLDKFFLRSKGFSIVEEFKAQVINKDIKFTELPITCNKRQGSSRLSPLKDGIKNVAFLLRLFYEFKLKKNQ